MAKGFIGMQNERKFDYIFLLYARYEGKIARLAKTMGIPQDEIRNWDAQFGEEVKQWIKNKEDNNAKKTAAITSDIGVPTIEDLKKQIMVQMKSSIDGEEDPSRLARALAVLNDMEKDEEEKMKEVEAIEDDEADIDSAVDKALKNK